MTVRHGSGLSAEHAILGIIMNGNMPFIPERDFDHLIKNQPNEDQEKVLHIRSIRFCADSVQQDFINESRANKKRGYINRKRRRDYTCLTQ